MMTGEEMTGEEKNRPRPTKEEFEAQLAEVLEEFNEDFKKASKKELRWVIKGLGEILEAARKELRSRVN